MENKVEFINHLQELPKLKKGSLQVKIAEWLRKKNVFLRPASKYLHLAKRIGVAWELFDYEEQDHPEMPNAVGIINAGLLGRPTEFIGTIVFGKNETQYWKDANTKHWILEAYGKGYVEYLKELAEEMTEQFDVKISIHLIREVPRIGFLIKPKNARLEI